jgi:hypothetical protein
VGGGCPGGHCFCCCFVNVVGGNVVLVVVLYGGCEMDRVVDVGEKWLVEIAQFAIYRAWLWRIQLTRIVIVVDGELKLPLQSQTDRCGRCGVTRNFRSQGLDCF